LQGGVMTVLRGEVRADRDGLADPRVAKGLVYDERKKLFVAQGKLTDEYISSLIGS
jgi:hypothetical protein